MKKVLLLLSIVCLKTNGKLYLDGSNFPMDTDLFDRVLDPEECQRQLKYMRQNDSLLIAQFLDSGMRAPRGVLLGNLLDLGNYLQCLAINENVEDMSIEGKFCMIRIPIQQNLNLESSVDRFQFNFDPRTLHLHRETVDKLNEYERDMRGVRATFGEELKDYRMNAVGRSGIAFHMAVCLPKVCTTEETLNGLVFNLTALDFKYEDNYCRLPNDKPWAAVDYVAVVLFSILGLLTVLSIGYDVHHNVICKKDPKEASDILISFSALTNCRRLLVIESNSKSIQCIDGVRSLAILWVVVGHVFYAIGYIPANPLHAIEWIQSYASIWVTAATFSVDTFFLLSGLLLVYVTAAKFTGNELIKYLPVFYLNRILRLFPVLAAVVLYEASFSNRVGDGPLWSQLAAINVYKCRQFWWTTLLHVQNFVNPRESCLGVTWYLAIDVQLHILSPIVLFWVLGRSRFSAWTALLVTVFGCLAASTAYIFTKEFSDVYVYYYVNILTRAPAFTIGLVYGYMLHVFRKRRPKIHTVLSSFITACSIVLLIIIIYCNFKSSQLDFDNTIIENLFYSFLRPLWALGVGWIVFACANGYGGPINWFLSLNIWKIPARISYAMYLIHLSLMFVVYSTSLNLVYFTVESALFSAIGFLGLTMFVSFFVTALIDAPFAILFKKLFEHASFKQLHKNSRKVITEGTINHQNGNLPIKNRNHVTIMHRD